MSLLHHDSCESIDSGLDLFSIPPTQTSVESGQYVEYQPLTSLNPSGTIEFNINNKNSSEYLDLSHTYLYVRFKIVNSDGKNLEADAKVAPVNNFLHSLFSQVDVSLNNTLITTSENTYGYRSIIENLLTYNGEAKRSQLTTELFYGDTPGKLDSITENTGWGKRQKLTEQSKEVDLYGRIHSEVFHLDKYLLNSVDVRVRLIKSKEAFHLIADKDGYKTSLSHVSLFVRKVRINPGVLLQHSLQLEKTTAKYFFKRVTLKTFSIPTGNLSSTLDNIFLSQLPTRVVIGCVSSGSFNGDVTKNPFNFDHHNLSYISLFVDGKQIPNSPLLPNFKNNLYVRSFHQLFSETGLASKNEGNNISLSDFGKGFSLFVFDLSPSLLDGNQIELVRSGSLRVELKFSDPLSSSIHVLVYGELDSLIEIDKTRSVVTDYSA